MSYFSFFFSSHSSKSNLNIKTGGEPQQFQKPAFLTESLSKAVHEGATVTLDCVANGNPRPQIKWLRNGEDIDISDLDSKFQIVGTGSLHISSVNESDAGNFQCRASNSIDSTDMEISLMVQVPPKFIKIPTDRIAYEKDELEMVCSIWGKPTPIIQWLKNGDVITPNDYMQIVNGYNQFSYIKLMTSFFSIWFLLSYSSQNLRILGLIDADAGMFQCVGNNPAGSIQAAARLEIIKPSEY